MPGIPEITPYPMPTAGELPAAGVDWTVDPDRAVLLIHDLQKFFLSPFPAGQQPVTELVRNSGLLRDRCAALGVPVAYTAQPGGMTPEQRGLLRDFWGPGMTPSPEHREVVAPVRPVTGDWMLTKWRYSAFFKTDLLDRMRGAGRDQLIICGVYAHVGVLATAVEAFTQDIQAFLVADAVADFSRAEHESTLRYAAGCCAAVSTSEEILRSLPVAGLPGGRARAAEEEVEVLV